jgi:hypothetical protein
MLFLSNPPFILIFKHCGLLLVAHSAVDNDFSGLRQHALRFCLDGFARRARRFFSLVLNSVSEHVKLPQLRLQLRLNLWRQVSAFDQLSPLGLNSRFGAPLLPGYL